MFQRKTVLAAAVLVAVVIGCVIPALAEYRQIGQVSGFLTDGDWEWIAAGVTRGRQYKLSLSVPWNADFDVKIYYDRNNNRIAERTELVEQGIQATGQDEVIFFVPLHSGDYFIKVYSYRGSGFYTLRLARWF